MEHISPQMIIDALGGSSEVARMCEVEPQAVSQWKKRGIPSARLMYLRLAKPDVFKRIGEGSLSDDGKVA